MLSPDAYFGQHHTKQLCLGQETWCKCTRYYENIITVNAVPKDLRRGFSELQQSTGRGSLEIVQGPTLHPNFATISA